jgi:hypothetical protein
MSKLTARDFKRSPGISPDNDPSFENVKTKFVPKEKVKDKLPEPAYRIFAREARHHRWPEAWILKVKHKDHKAYAIVSKVDSEVLEVRVLDKHGKIILRTKQGNYDSIDE